MRRFALYPVEQHWCSFADYGAILDITRACGAETVLEFGPGSSTLALIEAGARAIDACESDPHWFAINAKRLASHRGVSVIAYRWADPIRIAQTDGKTYDLGMIDGPKEMAQRPAAIAYALTRCAAVLVALEEAGNSRFLRPIVKDFADQFGRKVDIFETGPLAGAFALLA